MKLLLVCAAYPPHGKGGGPVASQMIAHALAQRNDVTVITVSDRYEQWQDGPVPVRSIGSPNIYWNYWTPHSAFAKAIWHLLENFNLRAFFRIFKEIKRERPDIVATISIENVNVATWLAARVCGIPTAHFIQSYFLLCWRGSMFRQNENCKVVTMGRKRLSTCVNLVAAEASSTLKLHFDHGYFKNAASFVATGMLAEMPPPRITKADGSVLRVGYIGVLMANKGVHLIARAAKKLLDPSQVDVLIGGNGEAAYSNQLQIEFQGIPTSFEGWVSPEDFYRKIDVLVVPSLWREPFGRVCIEAFAAGVPVIASAIGGLATIIENNRNGFLFEPGDTDRLAGILDFLIQNRNSLVEMQANCLEDASRYSAECVGHIIEQQLQTLVGTKHSN